MALLVYYDPQAAEHQKMKVKFHVSGIVMLTLLINGVFITPIYKKLEVYRKPAYHDQLCCIALLKAGASLRKVALSFERHWFFHNCHLRQLIDLTPDLVEAAHNMSQHEGHMHLAYHHDYMSSQKLTVLVDLVEEAVLLVGHVRAGRGSGASVAKRASDSPSIRSRSPASSAGALAPVAVPVLIGILKLLTQKAKVHVVLLNFGEVVLALAPKLFHPGQHVGALAANLPRREALLLLDVLQRLQALGEVLERTVEARFNPVEARLDALERQVHGVREDGLGALGLLPCPLRRQRCRLQRPLHVLSVAGLQVLVRSDAAVDRVLDLLDLVAQVADGADLAAQGVDPLGLRLDHDSEAADVVAAARQNVRHRGCSGFPNTPTMLHLLVITAIAG